MEEENKPKYYNEVSKRATMKYLAANFEAITIRFRKEDNMRERLKSHAELTGESVVAFINRAVEETMRRDRARIKETMKNAPKPTETEEE